VNQIQEVVGIGAERRAERLAFDGGYACGLHGPNTVNCHFSLFDSRDLMRAWEAGRRVGERELQRLKKAGKR
jgi:hypothetical protein